MITSLTPSFIPAVVNGTVRVQSQALVLATSPIVFSTTKPYNLTQRIFMDMKNVSYGFYLNGTIAFTTSAGIFRISPPKIAGSSIGPFLTLWSNSSMIQYRYLNGLTTGILNITRIQNSYGLSYAVRVSHLPIIGNTTFAVKFVNSVDTFLGGNNSSIVSGSTVFDWFDSLNFKPVYTIANNTITWSVGSSFLIDPSISFDLTCSGSGSGASSYMTATFNEINKDLNVVSVAILTATVSVSTVTDSDGNTFTFLEAINNVGNVRDEIWTATNGVSDLTDAITVNLSGTSNAVIVCSEYSGVGSIGNLGSKTGTLSHLAPGGASVTLQSSANWAVGSIAEKDAITLSGDPVDCPNVRIRKTLIQSGGPVGSNADNGGGDSAGLADAGCWISGSGSHQYAALGLELIPPNQNPTTTTYTCPVYENVGFAFTCTAVVTDTSGTPSTPTGTVSINDFALSCTLSGTSTSSASCQIVMNPQLLGTITFTAVYSSDSTHTASSGTTTVVFEYFLQLGLIIGFILFILFFVVFDRKKERRQITNFLKSGSRWRT